jgi:hypothetical protein
MTHWRRPNRRQRRDDADYVRMLYDHSRPVYRPPPLLVLASILIWLSIIGVGWFWLWPAFIWSIMK